MAALLSLGTLSVQAAPLAYDTFEDYTAATNIHGQTGGSGWNGAWTVQAIGSGSTGTATVSATEITYNYGGATLGGGQSLLLSNTSNGTQRNVFASTNTGGSDYYVSFIFRFSGTVFAGVQALDGDPDIANDSIGMVNATGSVGARVDSGTSSSANGLVVENTTYFMVVQYTGWTGTNYSTVNLWINPNTGAQSGSSISATYTDPTPLDGGGSAGFLGFYVRTTIDSVPAESMLIDDLRVGTDWASVTAIPEPGTASLSAGGVVALLALCTRRRHRI